MRIQGKNKCNYSNASARKIVLTTECVYGYTAHHTDLQEMRET